MKVRTRFAPSPTGFMHLGNLRTALYTYLFAKSQKGTFILRVEDTDQAREVEGAVEIIYSSLKKVGINWDEGPDVGGDYGPYIQSQRKEMYKPYAQELVEKGGAYYCFCNKERLDNLRKESQDKGEAYRYDRHCYNLCKDEITKKLANDEEYVIRQYIPTNQEASFDDAIFGHIKVNTNDLDEGVLLKADGLPTYNFANVIDDHLMNITHVMRGSEYLASTPKYNLLYNSFGWDKPVYIHLSLIMADSKRKLSKRHGDPSFEDLLAEGFLIDAVVNYMTLLGWSPGDDREIMNMDELIESFSIDGLSKSPAIFDKNKLAWVNAEYIRALDLKDFHDYILPYMQKIIDTDKFDTMLLAELLQKRCEVLPDIMEKIDFLAQMPDYDLSLYFHKRMKTSKDTALPVLEALLPKIKELETWSIESIKSLLSAYIQEIGCKNGFVLWPFRVAISGKMSTPGGAYEIAVLLGKEETINRLNKSISMLK